MKNNMKAMVASFVLFSTFNLTVAQAAPTQSSTSEQSVSSKTSNRDMKRFGAYLGILGDPHPTNVGINIAYNVLQFMRASVGFGKISTGASISMDESGNFAASEESQTTIGAAVKFLMPGWNLSPSVALGYSHISLSEGMINPDYKSSNLYAGLGADWQAASGFNLGAGLNLSLNGGAPTAPYVNVGVFF